MIAWKRPKSWSLKLGLSDHITLYNVQWTSSWGKIWVNETLFTSISFISLSALGGRTCVNIILVSGSINDGDIFAIMIIAKKHIKWWFMKMNFISLWWILETNLNLLKLAISCYDQFTPLPNVSWSKVRCLACNRFKDNFDAFVTMQMQCWQP